MRTRARGGRGAGVQRGEGRRGKGLVKGQRWREREEEGGRRVSGGTRGALLHKIVKPGPDGGGAAPR